MNPIPEIDVNDVIKREKLFVEHVSKFMEGVKLNLPSQPGKQIRSDGEIALCDKVKDEREEGRKMKERERKIRESKYKKKNNNVKIEEFVGNEEFNMNKEEGEEQSIRKKGKNNDKKVVKKGYETKDVYKRKDSVYNKKKNVHEKTNQKFGKKNTGKKRLGKGRRAETRSKKTNNKTQKNKIIADKFCKCTVKIILYEEQSLPILKQCFYIFLYLIFVLFLIAYYFNVRFCCRLTL